MHVTIVSGLSGAGKSVALHTLEDEGFYCVDNLPGTMLPALIDNLIQSQSRHFNNMAIGIDARGEPSSIDSFLGIVDDLRRNPDLSIKILFLETNREMLIKRFSETRRKHPLTSASTPLVNAIDQEALMLAGMKEQADVVIDTSTLNLHQLREIIRHALVDTESTGPALQFQSFGFKHGNPSNTDFTFDVRCLPNPYWQPNLRALTGLDEPIVKFLQEHESVERMYIDIKEFLTRWLPVFGKESRAYLTISIGCTGGRHRSVYIADKLARHFATISSNVSIRHREIN